MKLPRRKFLHLAAVAAALPAASRIARAQAYPSRPVRIIEGFGAGSALDIVARLIGQSLSGQLGHLSSRTAVVPAAILPPRRSRGHPRSFVRRERRRERTLATGPIH